MARRVVPLTTALALLMSGASAGVAAASTQDPSAAPSSGVAEPDPELVEEADADLADDTERIEAAETSAEMAADATTDLRAADSTFALRPEDSTTSLEREREDEGEKVVTLTSDLLFDFGKATLSPDAKAAVADLATEIPQDATVRVDGYTDSVGSDAFNARLSTKRANAVADVLAAERPDLTLTVAGHGEADPVAENEAGGADNPAGRALNRRVEVTYPTA
ncbi:OmpA family protein [Isoptericola hypogeus]|uniref:OmpA family protein n=1 Tax=Isoptericola hypogeus TaxID=300179 RepID=UPI0031CE2478